MNIAQIMKFVWKQPTCSGCKFLYSEGLGYSNDQRTGTRLSCAINHQPQLPMDFQGTDSIHPLHQTLKGCHLHSSGQHISLDVAGREGASLYSTDPEQIEAITNHSGRPVEGEPHSWALANLIRARQMSNYPESTRQVIVTSRI